MHFEILSSQAGVPSNQIGSRAHWGGSMEGRTRRNATNVDCMRALQDESEHRSSHPSAHFSLELFLLLLFFTASLLILPLVLPPLPPPPSMLLLLPIALLAVLLLLAFMPSDIRKITTSYL
ncbi:hypothetical protein Cni_G09103 [Canna indica]|uniref:ARGOS-like protein n=1 Tax=Canna indica TaxID=4628 RepID=A0AAQ3Q9B2_9LILI|nr:hypothetical protein Cni_G09103 [Canna indica]